LAEWLILTMLLGLAWWQCARWPMTVTIRGGKLITPVEAMPLVAAQFEPSPNVIAKRCAISSAATIGVWLAGSIAVRARVRATGAAKGNDPRRRGRDVKAC
jgi:hypothetical protein